MTNLAKEAMNLQEKAGSLRNDILTGKYDSQIDPSGKARHIGPPNYEIRTKCIHCGYDFGFNIDFPTDYQRETLFRHMFQREDIIWDLCRAPEGATFKTIQAQLESAGYPISLSSLHDCLQNMLKHKVIKSEAVEQLDAMHHKRKTLIYHSVVAESNNSNNSNNLG